MIYDLRKTRKEFIYAILGIFCIGLGRASYFWWLAPVTASAGYACCWMALQQWTFRKACALFFFAYLLQTTWMLSHPYAYIILVWPILALALALPLALVSKIVVKAPYHAIFTPILIASIHTLIEWGWSILPFGFTLHSAALCLSWNLSALQLAGIVGGIGVSWYVFFTNALFYYWWKTPTICRFVGTCFAVLFPYVAGSILLKHHTKDAHFQTVAICHMEEPPDVFSAHLSPQELVEQEWNKIFPLLLSLKPGSYDCIVLPEGVVPFAASAQLFRASKLPSQLGTSQKPLLSSLEISQKLSSYLQAPLIIGLEGRSLDNGRYTSFNSCYCIAQTKMERYDKQLLLPFGEYIPCECFRKILSAYGIHNSYSPGTSSVLFEKDTLRAAPFICYEETSSTYTLPVYKLQPKLLVSLSNDNWFPCVRNEHFEIARIRAVELGIPLIRACNQGVSGVIDGYGQAHGCTKNTKENKLLTVCFPCTTYQKPFPGLQKSLLFVTFFSFVFSGLCLLRRK
jgi:apolipoprotein N-acyltransferase